VSFLPVLFGALTAFCWGTADYMSRRSSQKVGSYRTVVYMHVVSILTLVVLIPILNPPLVISTNLAAIMVAASLLNFFAFIFLYRGFHRGIVSVVAPIAYSFPAVTTVLAVLILGAVLSGESILALLAVMTGVILVSTKFSELYGYARNHSGLKVTPGVGSAILSASSFGTVYIGVGYVTPKVGYYLPALFLRVLGGVCGFLFAPVLKESIRPNRQSINAIIVVMGILETIGILSFNAGVAFGASSLPIVAALSGMGGAFATTYALVFLRERLEFNQVFGIILSFLGVFALLYLTS
jgi:drug/metabolite transporter (DMT)-like permease